MKVLVTGAKGMLGQDLCPIFEKEGYEVIPTDYDTLDITDEAAMNKAADEIKPDIIIHCAAYTNVDKAENDYEGDYKLNVTGAKNVAMAAARCNAVMIYISTDYVFDGKKETPYLPSDEPNPISVYGKTKYLGELEVQKYCKKYYIARTAWLYGINGKNFVETMISMASKMSGLKVVDDQTGSPTWTYELIYGILKLLNNNSSGMPYGVYHVSGEGEVSWHGFAKEIFEKENIKIDLKPCTTDEFPRDAKRPKYSYMTNENGLTLTRDWKLALADYLKQRKEV